MTKYRLTLQSWGLDENGTRTFTNTIIEGDELPIMAAYYSTRMELRKDFESDGEQKADSTYLYSSDDASVTIKLENYED